jgi:hypothetical protein
MLTAHEMNPQTQQNAWPNNQHCTPSVHLAIHGVEQQPHMKDEAEQLTMENGLFMSRPCPAPYQC